MVASDTIECVENIYQEAQVKGRIYHKDSKEPKTTSEDGNSTWKDHHVLFSPSIVSTHGLVAMPAASAHTKRAPRLRVWQSGVMDMARS